MRTSSATDAGPHGNEPDAPRAESGIPAEPAYAVATTLDHAGRILAPVRINGRGPFRFILDTGANRSVLSERLVAQIGAEPSAHTSIRVHGATGSAVLPAIRVRSIEVGELLLGRDQAMPVLSQVVLADADGILGVEGLELARIDIDFSQDRVDIRASTGRGRAPSSFLTIPISFRHGTLLTVPARVGRVRARAIIDTGAERTLGNLALQNALLRSRRTDPGPLDTTVFGATPELGQGTTVSAPTIYVGEARLQGLVVTFADLHVFRVWGLEKEPAIVIGMDLLGTVQRLVIDYRRRELQLLPSAAPGNLPR